MISNLFWGVLAFWAYRRIGVLSFKIRHAFVDHRGTGSVSFDRPPDFFRYLLCKKIFRGRLRWFWPEQQLYSIAFYDRKFRKYLWREYKEIYGWPWLILNSLYQEYRRRITDQIWIKFRLRGKQDLKNSRFQELALMVEAILPGFKLIELEKSGGENQLHLKLPGKTMTLLGPWSKEVQNQHNWFLLSDFHLAAYHQLCAKLRLPSLSPEENLRTTEVIVVVRDEVFCGNPYWGDFKPEKWETWKEAFIDFFRQIALKNTA